MPDSKNKIIVCHVVEPTTGGAPKHVALLAEHMPRDRFLTVLVYPTGRPVPLFQNLSHVQHHPLPMAHAISPWKDVMTLCRLVALFLKLRPHIVHTHSSKAGFLGRLAAWLAGVRAVYYTPHGFSFLRRDVPALGRAVFAWLEKLCGLWTHRIIAVSQGEAWDAETIAPPHKILINPNGIPLTDKNSGIHDTKTKTDQKIVIGTAGRITPAKNPPVFFDLARKMTRSHPRLQFLWIGGSETSERPFHPPYTERIEITGWLSPEEAEHQIDRLDIFVMTSQWEGLPFALLEAMGRSKPVVVLNIPGLREAVEAGQNGYVAENIQEMEHYLGQLCLDENLRRRMGERSRRIIEERYSIGSMTSRLEKIYRSGLGAV